MSSSRTNLRRETRVWQCERSNIGVGYKYKDNNSHRYKKTKIASGIKVRVRNLDSDLLKFIGWCIVPIWKA